MYSVRDSSIPHNNPAVTQMANVSDPSIKIGIVREVQSSDAGVKYVVEVYVAGRSVLLTCATMTRLGGVQNYEEYNLRPYKKFGATVPLDTSPEFSYGARVGDTVVVACVNGKYQEGVILGGLKHPGRTTKLDASNIAYISQFNGLETTIDNSGTYKVKNKSLLSTGLDAHIPGLPIPPELSNPATAGNYLEINSDGSTTLSDGATQSLIIDRVGLKTTIKSGLCTIVLDAKKSADISAPMVSISATATLDTSAKITTIKSDLSTSIKTAKFAVGNEAFELIDGLIKLIDAMGTLVVTSPTGPCTPLVNSPTWLQVLLIKTKLTAFKGSL